MKTLIKLVVTLSILTGLAKAQTQRYTNICSDGAKHAITSGLNSTNFLEAAYPSCTVTVYYHGTVTLATIYSDASSTPLANPFTAAATAIYGFYAATSTRYDVQMSGLGMTTTTIADITLGGSGSGGTGCIPSGAVGSLLTTGTSSTCAGLASLGSTITLLHGNASGLPTFGAVNLATDVTGALPHANIASTAVTPGAYTNANITVAADGSVTAAANGSGGGGGASFPSTVGDICNTSTSASIHCTPTFYAVNFSGADAGAKINACNAAAIAAGGGTCDDTGVLPPSTVTSPATATAEIEIGDNIAGVATVRHIFGPQFALRSSISDITKCAVRIWNRGILQGYAAAGGGGRADIYPGAGSTMEGLLCSDVSNVNAQNYIRVTGIDAINDNGSTLTHVVDFEDLADQSEFTNGFYNNQTGDTIFLGNVCCGMIISGIQAFGSNLSGTANSTGGIPLTLGGYGYITIDHSTFNRPVNGQANINITGTPWNLRLESVYMEGNGATDSTTPMVIIGSGSTGFSSIDSEASPCFSCGAITKPSYRNNSGGNWALIAPLSGGQPNTGVLMFDNNSGRTYHSAGERNMNPSYFGGSGFNYFDNLNANVGVFNLLNLPGTASPMEFNGSAGTSGQCAMSAGSGATPTWGTCGTDTGNTTSTSLTTNSLPKANGANSIINSAVSDDGTTVTSTEPIAAPSVALGTPSAGALAALPTGAHGFACDESSTAGVPAATVDYIRCDSITHNILKSVNGGAEQTITVTIASGTSALGTSAIASGACATVVTTTATGVASTDAIAWNANGSIKAVTGYVPSTSGGLTISMYPGSGNVNTDVCNWTAGSITPGSVTLNWRVTR